MLQFNSRGLLTPETIIVSTLEEFENEFVIKQGSEKRKDLFQQYRLYNNKLKNICGDISLTQWINGSFTTKSAHPADIDLVTFIDSEIVKQHYLALKDLIYHKVC